MAYYPAVAIANEFLRRREGDAWPSQVLIQKLAYIAHGWTLAITGEPLIDESPQAWDNGPVFRTVWDHIKDHGYNGPNYQLCAPKTGEPIVASLTATERAIIDHVWQKYGGIDPNKLSKMTHEPGTPWSNAYMRYRNAPLDQDEIRNHYIELGLAGREQRQAS